MEANSYEKTLILGCLSSIPFTSKDWYNKNRNDPSFIVAAISKGFLLMRGQSAVCHRCETYKSPIYRTASPSFYIDSSENLINEKEQNTKTKSGVGGTCLPGDLSNCSQTLKYKCRKETANKPAFSVGELGDRKPFVIWINLDLI